MNAGMAIDVPIARLATLLRCEAYVPSKRNRDPEYIVISYLRDGLASIKRRTAAAPGVLQNQVMRRGEWSCFACDYPADTR